MKLLINKVNIHPESKANPHGLTATTKHENKRDKNVPPIDRRGFLTPQKEILFLFSKQNVGEPHPLVLSFPDQ
ncbi:MAG: hypothetical protein A3G93_05180 [Nitrospinae bacterium RIFCSPLOWO2_12_FULL_45_22]|nr:MAG: hypothetical protein A3G93_05180 [Nitrospinae bacterium RIFCSPLOWO2_12_FULL_45_22]